MTGPKKPVVQKRVAVQKPVVHVVKPPVVYYEVETISGSKRSVDKFE
jgi:hypothetical protein